MDRLTDISPMPFGKHKGLPMKRVPVSYLHFLWNKGLKNDNGGVAMYVRENMSVLKDEDRNLEWDPDAMSGSAGTKEPEPSRHLADGLYQVATDNFVAGFVVRGGRVKKGECAPILRKNLKYWVQFAIWIGLIPETVSEETLYTKLK